jgi:Flp pilus assembly protein TadG
MKSERGTALVEFALVLPLLSALFLGIVNFGRALDYYNQMTQAVSQGARAAAVDQNPSGAGAVTANSIQTQVVNGTAQPELKSGMKICITGPVPTAVGQPVTVTGTFNFSLWPSGIIPIPKPSLSTSSTERAEVVPSTGVGYTASCSP